MTEGLISKGVDSCQLDIKRTPINTTNLYFFAVLLMINPIFVRTGTRYLLLIILNNT